MSVMFTVGLYIYIHIYSILSSMTVMFTVYWPLLSSMTGMVTVYIYT